MQLFLFFFKGFWNLFRAPQISVCPCVYQFHHPATFYLFQLRLILRWLYKNFWSFENFFWIIFTLSFSMGLLYQTNLRLSRFFWWNGPITVHDVQYIFMDEFTLGHIDEINQLDTFRILGQRTTPLNILLTHNELHILVSVIILEVHECSLYHVCSYVITTQWCNYILSGSDCQGKL